MAGELVSIIISNFNYARFLERAIENALNQSYHPIEVIVVDDGSTDASCDAITRFNDRVIAIFKKNGGQASAINAGFSASSGQIVCLLDADDFYYVNKVETVADFFVKYGFTCDILVHHRLDIVDKDGNSINITDLECLFDRDTPFLQRCYQQRSKSYHPSPLNLYEHARRYRNVYYAAGPTTGLSLTRTLANKIFPLPEMGLNLSADDFVVKAASLIGNLYAVDQILGAYRVHGHNSWYGSSRAKSPEFNRQLDTYLNGKLTGAGLEPVISYYNSVYSWGNLVVQRRWAQLISKMWRAFILTPDLHTLEFAYKVGRLSAVRSIRALLASTK
jgi:glycosyltransferase involved in cell wall biosynthesis